MIIYWVDMLLLTRLVVAEAVEPNKETQLVSGAENKSQQPSKKKKSLLYA